MYLGAAGLPPELRLSLASEGASSKMGCLRRYRTLSGGGSSPDRVDFLSFYALILALQFALMIRFPRCTKRYGSLEAVRDPTLTIAPGEVYALLGSNRAEKTTAFRCRAIRLKPSSGTASLLSWRSTRRSEGARHAGDAPPRCPCPLERHRHRNVRDRGVGRCGGGTQSRWHAAHVPTRAHSHWCW